MKFSIRFFLFIISTTNSYSQITKLYTNDRDSVVDKSIATKYIIQYFDSSQNRKIKEIYSIDALLKFKISYLYDVKDGLYIAYYSNGNISDSGFFKADTRFGKWNNYHTNGKLASIVNYNGYLSSPISCDNCWDENGDIEKCVNSKQPQFVGGNDNLYSFISKNIKYPKDAKNKGISGNVIVSIIIDCFGNVTNPQIYKSVNIDLDNELLRVVKMMPNWIPAKFYNKPIIGHVNIPFNFIL